MLYLKFGTVLRIAYDLDNHVFSILSYDADGVAIHYDGPPVCYVKLIVYTLVVDHNNQRRVNHAINTFLSGNRALERLF